MSQKSFLDNKKSRKNFPYVSSFLFLKASLTFMSGRFDKNAVVALLLQQSSAAFS